MNDQAQSIVIIADDVTGAADSAARCRHAGLSAVIDLSTVSMVTDRDRYGQSIDPGGAIAFSTDSRFLPPEQAALQVSNMIAPLAAIMQTRKPVQNDFSEHGLAPPPIEQHNSAREREAQHTNQVRWYKKIDSTLRGNIGSEIEAMLPLLTPPGIQPCAVICPAFPAQQRTLVDGYLGYAGLPPRSVHLPTVLAEQSDLPVTIIALSTLRAEDEELREAIWAAYQVGKVLFVVDAETEDDLRRLLWAITEVMPDALLCGSAGLVGVLAQQLAAATPPAAKSIGIATPHIQHPLLAVIGSASQMAHQQIDYLKRNADVTIFEVDPERIANGAIVLDTVSQPFYGQTRDVVLHLPPAPPGAKLEGDTARQYATILATVAHAIIPAMQPATLLLVGGDTAVHTLAMLEIHRLMVLTELLPGMPLTVARDGQGREYQIVLKAGNHGDKTTLAYLLRSG